MLLKKKFAFSLVELLISLIVISCITAAFTPIITKKFSSGVFGGGSAGLSGECKDISSDCKLCDKTGCVLCNIETCIDGEYRDVKKCKCIPCTETYGDDCTECNEKKCLTCASDEYLDSDDNCKSCSDKFNHCATCTESECTSCSDGYVLTNPTSSTPCSSFSCSSPDFIQIGNLCITKKNMGDSSTLPIPSGVTVANVNQTCNSSSSNKCCWKGATSGTNCDNNGGGAYSGCNRTVCTWYAADYICSNFTAGGRTWRLATKDEMSNWATNSKGLGVNGLQLCDRASGYSSAYCNGSISCPGSYGDWCGPHGVWSGTVGVSSYTYYYNLVSGSWGQLSNYRTNAFSVRCVAEVTSCADKIGAGCEMCDGNKCLKCASGYILKNGKCEEDCTSKFGANCTACTTSACTACASGYHISNASSNPACVADFTCSGSDFMKIGSLCVTRKNMGDSSTLPIPSGVTVASVNQTCNSSSSNKCCWKGNTSGTNCDNANGGAYSGCNRTVCDWYAADYICKNFTAGGRTWRLATSFEMSKWGTNSIGKGVNGLQLCDYSSGYSSAYCDTPSSCPGSGGDVCYPYRVWSGTVPGLSYAYYYALGSDSWGQLNNGYRPAAFSVRCVTEL